VRAIHRGIAAELSTAREVVSRILKEFERCGCVGLTRSTGTVFLRRCAATISVAYSLPGWAMTRACRASSTIPTAGTAARGMWRRGLIGLLSVWWLSIRERPSNEHRRHRHLPRGQAAHRQAQRPAPYRDHSAVAKACTRGRSLRPRLYRPGMFAIVAINQHCNSFERADRQRIEPWSLQRP